MVKLNTTIQQNDLPTVSNLTAPNPSWNQNASFDYTQYLNKKKGKVMYRHALNKPLCKPDENFKIETYLNNDKFFYNYTDYSTMINISKIYNQVHPYCQLNLNGNQLISGEDIFLQTTDENIAGMVTTEPIQNIMSKTQLNEIKGHLQIDDRCINFLNGFKPDVNYNYNL